MASALDLCACGECGIDPAKWECESRFECMGCCGPQTETEPTGAYLVTHHDGTRETVRYCDDCAMLARGDWNGNTASIEAVGAAL